MDINTDSPSAKSHTSSRPRLAPRRAVIVDADGRGDLAIQEEQQAVSAMESHAMHSTDTDTDAAQKPKEVEIEKDWASYHVHHVPCDHCREGGVNCLPSALDYPGCWTCASAGSKCSIFEPTAPTDPRPLIEMPKMGISGVPRSSSGKKRRARSLPDIPPAKRPHSSNPGSMLGAFLGFGPSASHGEGQSNSSGSKPLGHTLPLIICAESATRASRSRSDPVVKESEPTSQNRRPPKVPSTLPELTSASINSTDSMSEPNKQSTEHTSQTPSESRSDPNEKENVGMSSRGSSLRSEGRGLDGGERSPSPLLEPRDMPAPSPLSSTRLDSFREGPPNLPLLSRVPRTPTITPLDIRNPQQQLSAVEPDAEVQKIIGHLAATYDREKVNSVKLENVGPNARPPPSVRSPIRNTFLLPRIRDPRTANSNGLRSSLPPIDLGPAAVDEHDPAFFHLSTRERGGLSQAVFDRYRASLQPLLPDSFVIGGFGWPPLPTLIEQSGHLRLPTAVPPGFTNASEPTAAVESGPQSPRGRKRSRSPSEGPGASEPRGRRRSSSLGPDPSCKDEHEFLAECPEGLCKTWEPCSFRDLEPFSLEVNAHA